MEQLNNLLTNWKNVIKIKTKTKQIECLDDLTIVLFKY